MYKSVDIKPRNHQQEQSLMDSGVTKVGTRVEEPDWIDLSHSSNPGEYLGRQIVDTVATEKLATSWKASSRIADHMTTTGAISANPLFDPIF